MASPLFQELQTLSTEQRNPRSMHLDTASVEDLVRLMHKEDQRISPAIEAELPYIADAVRRVVHAFQHGGRLFYIGAGTSGRLGVLDASECPPTFGVPPEMVQGLIAGGPAAVFKAQEGAEDRPDLGRQDLDVAGVTPKDVVCGIAASKRTPYVVGAIAYARELGATTLFITCNPRSRFDLDVDVAICADVGPEVLMGSTRLKSGTATKQILNMITTAAMVQLGKVYENMMVDLQLTNQKLVERARRIVMMATGLDYPQACQILEAAGGHVKTALVMALAEVEAGEARQRLDRAKGFVRAAIQG